MKHSFAVVALGAITVTACRASPEHRETTSAPASSRGDGETVVRDPAPRDSGRLRVEALDPDATPATFVLHGAGLGGGRLVFLHGMCGHALGYA